MSNRTNPNTNHECGGTILSNPSGGNYCDQCGAFTIYDDEPVPGGTDAVDNREAYDGGDERSDWAPIPDDDPDLDRAMSILGFANPALSGAIDNGKKLADYRRMYARTVLCWLQTLHSGLPRRHEVARAVDYEQTAHAFINAGLTTEAA